MWPWSRLLPDDSPLVSIKRTIFNYPNNYHWGPKRVWVTRHAGLVLLPSLAIDPQLECAPATPASLKCQWKLTRTSFKTYPLLIDRPASSQGRQTSQTALTNIEEKEIYARRSQNKHERSKKIASTEDSVEKPEKTKKTWWKIEKRADETQGKKTRSNKRRGEK